jgi:Holliday junction resolvase-like predicted endonuclease
VPERKRKGDLGEVMVAADLIRRGYAIAIPYGEDWDYDLIVRRGDRLERVRVKYPESNGEVIAVQCYSLSLTNGKVKRRKGYTAKMVEWIAVYDRTTDRCYYVPSSLFAMGRTFLHLRLRATRNNQRAGLRWAMDYLDF